MTRYAHQTGHHVDRRFGWDCHGLPVVSCGLEICQAVHGNDLTMTEMINLLHNKTLFTVSLNFIEDSSNYKKTESGYPSWKSKA